MSRSSHETIWPGLAEQQSPEDLCRFCRAAEAIHHRVATIFGSSSLCDDCLGEYREQVARAVDVWNRKHEL